MQLVLDHFLKDKIKEIDDIQSNASLELGKIFTEVNSRIGHKGNGVYLQWLKHTGYTQDAAMKHRKRYYVYTLAKTKKGKSIIKNASIKFIEYISDKTGGALRKIMAEVDKGITKEEIIEIIENSPEEKREPKKRISISELSDLDFLKSITDPKVLARCERKIKEYSKIITQAQETVKNKKTEIHNKNNLKLDTLK